MSKTIAEAWVEQGFEKGWAEGWAKGWAEGWAEGQLQASRTLLRLVLEDRFGPLPETLVQQIESSTDSQRLQTAVLQTLHLQKLEDLRI